MTLCEKIKETYQNIGYGIYKKMLKNFVENGWCTHLMWRDYATSIQVMQEYHQIFGELKFKYHLFNYSSKDKQFEAHAEARQLNEQS